MKQLIRAITGFLCWGVTAFIIWLAIAIDQVSSEFAWLGGSSRDAMLIATLTIVGTLYFLLGYVLLFRHSTT